MNIWVVSNLGILQIMLFCMSCTSFCIDVCIPRSGTVGSCIKCMVNFVRSCQTFSKWMYLSSSPPAVFETSSYSPSSSLSLVLLWEISSSFIIQLFCRAFISSIRLCINFQELFCFVNVLFWASCSYRMGATFPFVSVRIWLFFCSFLLPAESVSSQYTFPDHLSVCMSVAHVSFP